MLRVRLRYPLLDKLPTEPPGAARYSALTNADAAIGPGCQRGAQCNGAETNW